MAKALDRNLSGMAEHERQREGLQNEWTRLIPGTSPS
jgi:hypothetical protein